MRTRFVPYYAGNNLEAAYSNLAAQAFVLNQHKANGSRKSLLSVDMKGGAAKRGIQLENVHSADDATSKVSFQLRSTEQYAEFQNALSEQSIRTGGGALRGAGFVDALEVAQFSASPIRRLASVFRVPGNPVHRPGVDTSDLEAGIVDRNEITDSTPEFNRLELNKDAYLAKWALPMELEQDIAPATVTELAKTFGELIGNRQTREWTSGNGGLCNAAYAVPSAGASVSIDDLENLVGAAAHYADPENPSVCFMVSPAVFLVLRKLKDAGGNRVFQNFRLLDFKVALNRAMPSTIASGGSPVLFGDFSKFTIADTDEVQVAVYPETLIDRGQILWVARQESAGALLDAGEHPIARLTMSA